MPNYILHSNSMYIYKKIHQFYFSFSTSAIISIHALELLSSTQNCAILSLQDIPKVLPSHLVLPSPQDLPQEAEACLICLGNAYRKLGQVFSH